ncbi:MAG: GDSL-type esterase/lipase family protein [Pirellulales bacterium]
MCWTTAATAQPTDGAVDATQNAPLTIVAWGDSITKGTRQGVRNDETFSAIVQRQLSEQGIDTRVLNLGVGGERTDQALNRIEAVLDQHPRWVTVMYGTNDSYIDQGQSSSRLTIETYRENLQHIVAQLLLHGIEPILMTEPRWAQDATANGMGENPNVRLAPYMEACREVALAYRVPLVDHFADWTMQEQSGQQLREWTTDGCHPNPRGHRQIASHLMPTLVAALKANVPRIDYTIQLDTVLKHDDGKSLWFHPRVAALASFDSLTGDEPAGGGLQQPAVLMTLQKHLGASDHYSGLSVMQTDNLGETWSKPTAPSELAWTQAPRGKDEDEDHRVNIAVADVTPGWHPPTGKLIAIGAQVRYSPEGEQLDDQPRSHQTAYAIFDPQTNGWTRWQRLPMPEDEQFNFARSACAQFVVEPDGTLLLPFYVAQSEGVPFASTVVRCSFDGQKIDYLEHGDVLELDVARGLYEPSLVHFQHRYFMTLRNDLKGYVTVSDDGLHYRPVKPWLFDDGQELGSYNTQQHWLTHNNSLLLVYTRRGADNDHIMRHRAPLFIAQVDPHRLQVVKNTERVLVPERGATLGNFGAAPINEHQSWITVSEGIWNDDARQRGADGSLYVARVIWDAPKQSRKNREQAYFKRLVEKIEPSQHGMPERVDVYLRFFQREMINDTRLFAYHVESAWTSDRTLCLTGFVEFAETRTTLEKFLNCLGFDPIDNQIQIVPTQELGQQSYALVKATHAHCLEQPIAGAEVVTDSLMGDPVYLLKSADYGFFLCHTAEGYVGYLQGDELHRVDAEQFTHYRSGPQVSLLADQITTAGQALPVGAQLKWLRNESKNIVVELPTGEEVSLPATVSKIHNGQANERMERAIERGRQLLGTPYLWGGKTSAGIDCSGLVQVAFAAEGINLPRDASQQVYLGRLTATRWLRTGMRRGDTLYFLGTHGKISHTAIYLGAGQYLESAGSGVRISSLHSEDPNYDARRSKQLAFAKRLFE